jgi:hypothetical protein
MTTQNVPTQLQEQTETPAHDGNEQLFFSRALLLHFGPGAGVVVFMLLITPLLIGTGLPAQLGFLGGIALIGIPLELGSMLYLGKKRNGVLSLRGIVRYTQRMPFWQYAALFVPFVIYGLGLQIVHGFANSLGAVLTLIALPAH